MGLNTLVREVLEASGITQLIAVATSRDEALELLECLWIGMARNVEIYTTAGELSYTEGYAHWEATTIGGHGREVLGVEPFGAVEVTVTSPPAEAAVALKCRVRSCT